MGLARDSQFRCLTARAYHYRSSVQYTMSQIPKDYATSEDVQLPLRCHFLARNIPKLRMRVIKRVRNYFSGHDYLTLKSPLP